jgi:hypothetical protein
MEMERRNLPKDEFKKVRARFWANFDKSGIQGNDGVVRVIASKHRKKTE